MTKILRSLQFVTQSNPSTPNTGSGALFASASSFYFEDTTGAVFDLAASNGRIVSRSYTGSTDGTTVTYTWNKAPNLKYLDICCIGGGGGGGSGRCSTTINLQCVTGGGGGAVVWQWIEASRLANSYTITIGAGGTGSLGRVASGVAVVPGNGQDGGDTSFGTLVVAKGGDGGAAANRAMGGQGYECTPPRGPYAIQGTPAGWTTNTNTNTQDSGDIFDIDGQPTIFSTTVFQSITNWGNGGGGGGGGGGYTTGLVLFPGNSGSRIATYINNVLGGAGGAIGSGVIGGNGGNGIDNALTSLMTLSGSNSIYGLGTAGGGGGPSTIRGGDGGHAGYYGAGGGGGGMLVGLGSALVPSSSGAGGSGSSGLCLLIEYY